MAPSCAVAQWNGAGLHVWTHAQGLYNLRADLALALRMEPERIVVEHREGAGCYGHNGADDVVLDAALLARAAGERPVKVLWSRADELAWSPFGPAMLVDVAADVDASGAIVAWRGDVWSNGHGTRPGRGKTPVLLAASHLSNGFEPPVAVNAPFASGGGSERNSIPPYAIGWRRIRNHRVLSMPIRTSALRSLGAAANVFAIEAMVDDIARDRGEDPLAWRLRNLADPRARAVLQAAARRIGWSSRRAKEGTGFGIAFARYKHTAAYCAVAAEIEAGRDIRVRRLCIGVDVGLAINPDGVVNQIEGGAIQATSWALKEAVHFDRTRITSDAWAEYPILKFSEVPGVEVDVLQRVDEPSMGAGEASIGPTVAAIANAVCDALGLRVSSLPMTAERIAASAHAGTG
jgi:CO/xanthine dehydrogenase Mo-binding subunit